MGKEDGKKIYDKSNSLELLNMIEKIMFKVNTGKQIYMTKWKVKRETANLLQNNDTPEIYLEKFLRNVQVENQKEYGIWLDNGKIILELKITKGLTITWETAYSADIEKARKVATEKMKAMWFIQNS